MDQTSVCWLSWSVERTGVYLGKESGACRYQSFMNLGPSNHLLQGMALTVKFINASMYILWDSLILSIFYPVPNHFMYCMELKGKCGSLEDVDCRKRIGLLVEPSSKRAPSWKYYCQGIPFHTFHIHNILHYYNCCLEVVWVVTDNLSMSRLWMWISSSWLAFLSWICNFLTEGVSMLAFCSSVVIHPSFDESAVPTYRNLAWL